MCPVRNSQGVSKMIDEKITNQFDYLLSEMGPTWLAGAIAAGPATMASLITAGAGFGYTLLWIALLSAVLGATSQYLAARLGLLTEQGIVSTVEEHLGSAWAWLLVVDTILASGLAQLVIMKTVADVSATITGIDNRIWAVIWGLVLVFGLAGGGYRFAETGAKVLVSLVVLAFVASVFIIPIDLGAAARGAGTENPGWGEWCACRSGYLGWCGSHYPRDNAIIHDAGTRVDPQRHRVSEL